jgi:hypothetical protein
MTRVLPVLRDHLRDYHIGLRKSTKTYSEDSLSKTKIRNKDDQDKRETPITTPWHSLD